MMNMNYELGSTWKEVAVMYFRSTMPTVIWNERGRLRNAVRKPISV